MENKVKPNGKATLSVGGKSTNCPSTAARSARTSSTSASYTPRRACSRWTPVHVDRELRKPDHLHRWRRGHPAPPWLSDRSAGRKIHLPRGLLPAASRRVAERRAVVDFTARSRGTPCCTHSSTASSRASAATLTRWRSCAARSARSRRSIMTPPTSTIRHSARSRSTA